MQGDQFILAMDEYVIKVYNQKVVCEWLEDLVHKPYNVVGVLHNLNGITNHSYNPLWF